MERYVYAYNLERDEGEVFFIFRAFPEIISAVSEEEFDSWNAEDRHAHAEDAVMTALQAIMTSRGILPPSDNPDVLSAEGFVHLEPQPAMKLQLFTVYSANCQSISEFARRIGKQDTTARRLLNLRHRSTTDEIVEALAKFNIRLRHGWGTEQLPDDVKERGKPIPA